VEGKSFSKWYDQHLASRFDHKSDDRDGSGGTKGSGSGGTKGSDSGGTKGSGSGGTKGFGWGGTKGSGSGGTKGSGSGGTKGSGSGGTKGSGSGGTKGSGSGGTKGSGSGGTKGSGSGGTKGSGSGGTKGSGSGGTKGGGTKGGDTDPMTDPTAKITLNFVMGEGPSEINIAVTEDPNTGQLFFDMQQTDYTDGTADMDGLFFDLTDDSRLSSLNFFPDENAPGQQLTDIQANADTVNTLPNGAGVDQSYDVGLQFGLTPDTAEGLVESTRFTLWSDDGPVTFDDIDLSGMRLVINSETGNGEVLGVSSSDDPDFDIADASPDTDITFEDVMGLMSVEVEDEDAVPVGEEEEEILPV
jgi:hypothetical protein